MDDKLAARLLEGNILDTIKNLNDRLSLLEKLGGGTDAYSPIVIMGTGDVVGPPSSTDGNIALFQGTTGKRIREGGVPVIGEEMGIAGTTLAYGDLVYLSGVDNRWELADASAEATCKSKLGICKLAATGDGEITKVLTTGNVSSSLFPTMTVGQVMYASTTAGDISATPPSSNAGEIIRIVGHALGANLLYFHPSSDFFEIGTPASYGDVFGPSSAVDGNLVAFDTTTGKLIKDSGIAMSNPIFAPNTEYWKNVFVFDDFLGDGFNGATQFTEGSLGWTKSDTNLCLIPVVQSRDNHPGIIQMTVAPGGTEAYIRLGTAVNAGSYSNFGFGQFVILTPVDLLATGDGVVIGFTVTSLGFATDGSVQGVYFKARYGDTNWQAITRDVSGITQTDTGIEFTGATDNGVLFEIINKVTSIEFYINRHLVATHTTNVTPNQMAPIFGITSITDDYAFYIQIDYFGMQLAPLTTRWTEMPSESVSPSNSPSASPSSSPSSPP